MSDSDSDCYYEMPTLTLEEIVECQNQINDIVLDIPRESGKIMFEKILTLVDIIKHIGIDNVISKEGLRSLGKIILRRYGYERKSIDLTTEEAKEIHDAIVFLINL
jgi:hypothetical protein